ncbi:MAG: hypothetical protein LW875_10320 [Proteobacteria bacterium]|jgi:hypothetical protein|nr:hypothetical protein [Pseudomonadota bacterium]
MNIQELKERLGSELNQTWEKVQDSSLYLKAKDAFENLTPPMQKTVSVGSVLLLLYLVLSLPFDLYFKSADFEGEFVAKRTMIRDMLKVSRETAQTPELPVPPGVEELRNRVQQDLQAARILPEQVKSVSVSPPTGKLIPADLSQGEVHVALEQLNLRQVIDIGFQLQNLIPTVKLKDMSMVANQKDSRYFDVIYRLSVLSIPDFAALNEPAETPKKAGQ